MYHVHICHLYVHISPQNNGLLFLGELGNAEGCLEVQNMFYLQRAAASTPDPDAAWQECGPRCPVFPEKSSWFCFCRVLIVFMYVVSPSFLTLLVDSN